MVLQAGYRSFAVDASRQVKKEVKMSKFYSPSLMDTETSRDRSAVANELELEKLQIKKEIEELMKEYVKASGNKELSRRAFKVGKAPNDWKGFK
jgi:hypothetical protein